MHHSTWTPKETNHTFFLLFWGGGETSPFLENDMFRSLGFCGEFGKSARRLVLPRPRIDCQTHVTCSPTFCFWQGYREGQASRICAAVSVANKESNTEGSGLANSEMLFANPDRAKHVRKCVDNNVGASRFKHVDMRACLKEGTLEHSGPSLGLPSRTAPPVTESPSPPIPQGATPGCRLRREAQQGWFPLQLPTKRGV